MAESIQKVLAPLLIISYVCGLRVIKFPADDPKQWFSLLYILLLWSLYNFIMIYAISYTANFSIEYHVCLGLHNFTTLLSIVIGMYYDKIFKSSIKKFTIVDETLEKLGITTDYHKIKIKIAWIALGWSTIIILISYLQIYYLKEQNVNNNSIFTFLMRNYCFYVNFIGVLTIAIILGCTGLKFDQINKYLAKLSRESKHKMMLTLEHPVNGYQSRFSKASRNKHAIWIVMHLHLELHKISREIDSIFGTQLTLEIGCYFTFIISLTKEILNVIFIKNYSNNQMFYVILILFWFLLCIFRLILINYVCENVSTKANATKDLINKLSYSTCDVEVRENVLQFSLQTFQSPLRFYGLGLFQFGFKFLYGFSASVLTVLIIYLQAHTNNKYTENNN